MSDQVSREAAKARTDVSAHRQRRRVSRKNYKGLARISPYLTQRHMVALYEALKPVFAKGAIVDAAFWVDGSGDVQRFEALYENGVFIRTIDGEMEEFAPSLSFTVTIPACAPEKSMA